MYVVLIVLRIRDPLAKWKRRLRNNDCCVYLDKKVNFDIKFNGIGPPPDLNRVSSFQRHDGRQTVEEVSKLFSRVHDDEPNIIRVD